ncbi:hypothetical protein [Campylobacter concisus]|uniref:hypothetical protein n=1 Tax=Campylobacter concisus TaxID=199 RepID=UPI000CD898EF|nr:hypothetical protein [Campylobacter concisus]
MIFEEAVANFHAANKEAQIKEFKCLRPRDEVIAEFNQKLDVYWLNILEPELKEKFVGKELLVLQILKGFGLNERA